MLFLSIKFSMASGPSMTIHSAYDAYTVSSSSSSVRKLDAAHTWFSTFSMLRFSLLLIVGWFVVMYERSYTRVHTHVSRIGFEWFCTCAHLTRVCVRVYCRVVPISHRTHSMRHRHAYRSVWVVNNRLAASFLRALGCAVLRLHLFFDASVVASVAAVALSACVQSSSQQIQHISCVCSSNRFFSHQQTLNESSRTIFFFVWFFVFLLVFLQQNTWIQTKFKNNFSRRGKFELWNDEIFILDLKVYGFPWNDNRFHPTPNIISFLSVQWNSPTEKNH